MEVLRHASYLGSAPETSQGMVQCVMGSHSAVAARSLDLALDILFLCIPPCMPTPPLSFSLSLSQLDCKVAAVSIALLESPDHSSFIISTFSRGKDPFLGSIDKKDQPVSSHSFL